MPARVTLVCQAATRALRSGRFPNGDPIDERSAVEAAAAKARLPPAGRAWTSPDLAARQTCDILGLDAEPANELRDLDHGRWSGRRLKEIVRQEPDAFALWLFDHAASPHGGESLEAAFSRVGDWLERHAGDTADAVSVVSPNVFRICLCLSLHSGPGAFWRIDVEPFASATISRNGLRIENRPGSSKRT